MHSAQRHRRFFLSALFPMSISMPRSPFRRGFIAVPSLVFYCVELSLGARYLDAYLQATQSAANAPDSYTPHVPTKGLIKYIIEIREAIVVSHTLARIINEIFFSPALPFRDLSGRFACI